MCLTTPKDNYRQALKKKLVNIVTCTPITRQRVRKQVPAKTDSW
jgi:hypothetical protein